MNNHLISRKFYIIFILSIALNYIHGLECSMTKFYEIEPYFLFFTKYFTSIPESVYFTFHGVFWLFLPLFFMSLKGGKWLLIPLGLYGTVFITEAHHFVKGLTLLSYYPGMITSFLFPVLGIFYWIELIKLSKKFYNLEYY